MKFGLDLPPQQRVYAGFLRKPEGQPLIPVKNPNAR
jgi:hypothetical protein